MAIVAMMAAATLGQTQAVVWPSLPTPAYGVNQVGSSYSALAMSLASDNATTGDRFIEAISGVYAMMDENQEALGEDFEAIWNANILELYEP